ncbi:MAG: RHS domain-containing protein [Acidobacteriota bacterium]
MPSKAAHFLRATGSAGSWTWTLRDLDKKVSREFTSDDSVNFGIGNFQWVKDYIWRDGLLLATRQPDPYASGTVATYHYHLDHLGTPRQITDATGAVIARHDYLPFGPELSGNPSEPVPTRTKFTGHERDTVADRPPLDYMHARYYEGRLGRFLSVDPGKDWDPHQPQSWTCTRTFGTIPSTVRGPYREGHDVQHADLHDDGGHLSSSPFNRTDDRSHPRDASGCWPELGASRFVVGPRRSWGLASEVHRET